jgi:hypothetical protein
MTAFINKQSSSPHVLSLSIVRRRERENEKVKKESQKNAAELNSLARLSG